MKVAVTGVGGGVGQSIIKSLQGTEYDVIGIDSWIYASGLYALKKSYIGPIANDPLYIERITEICKRENCEVLFPGSDNELFPLSYNSEKLERNGIKPIVSNPDVVNIADDKMETQMFLKRNNFPFLKTYILNEYKEELDYPIILKPKSGGARSVGVYLVKNKLELTYYSSILDKTNYVVQEYINGEEMTCGTMSLDGNCCCTIMMKRELRCGDTYKAFVEINDELSEYLIQVINRLRPFGPCNVQLRIKDNVPYIFEFNARCSGTTASRALAGFNEPKMVLDYLKEGKLPEPPNIRKIAIFRYWKELPVEYDILKNVAEKGSYSGEKINL